MVKLGKATINGERKGEKEMSWREWIIRYSIIGVTILFIIIVALTINLKNIGDMTDGDFAIGLGTFTLAYATIILALNETDEGRNNREQARELAEKDRRRMRLKEQLEGLYSPLMSIKETDFLTYQYHRYTERERAGMYPAEKEHYVHRKMAELRSKYSFLATDQLRVSFNVYYGIDFNDEENENRIKFLIKLWDEIEGEFDLLSIKYSDLTKS